MRMMSRLIFALIALLCAWGIQTAHGQDVRADIQRLLQAAEELDRNMEGLEDDMDDIEDEIEDMDDEIEDFGEGIEDMETGVQAVATEVVGLREEVRELFSKQVQEMAHKTSNDMAELKEGMNEVRNCTDTLKKDTQDIKDYAQVCKNDMKGIERELIKIKVLANATDNQDLKTERTEWGNELEAKVQDLAVEMSQGFANQTKAYLEVREEMVGLQRDMNSTLYLLQELRSQLINVRQEISVEHHNILPSSCSEVLCHSGYYQLRNSSIYVYCDMDRQSCGCGSTRGWMKVADIDMTDPNQQCPDGFRLRPDTPKRMCEMTITSSGCTSIVFPTHNVQYNKVCGRVRAYQFGSPDAFYSYHHYSRTIDEVYLEGVSVTHGQNPRKHIWSFAGATDEFETRHKYQVCPCTKTTIPYTGTVPPFVGNDYFCDTGSRNHFQYIFYPNDPLWDGQGCGPTSSCCQFNSPPWFCKELPKPTTDDIEVRVCRDQVSSNEDTPFELIELYVQ